MDGQEQLRRLIEAHQERLRRTFPADRRQAIVALARARDWAYLKPDPAPHPAAPLDPGEEGHRRAAGWNKALQLCFGATTGDAGGAPVPAGAGLDGWAERLIEECGRLAAGERVLAHCETGFMQVRQGGERAFDAWITTRRMPAEWRERVDFAWWAAALARRHGREMDELAAERPRVRERLWELARRRGAQIDPYAGDAELDGYYRRLGALHIKRMACQYGYPPGAAIGGCAFQLYLDIMGVLIGWALKDLDRALVLAERDGVADLRPLLATPRAETALVEALAAALAADAPLVRRALRSCTLDGDNATYHGASPGVAAPPLIRPDEDALVWSLAGLLGEPLLFVTRELRRRYAREYHNTAYLREEVFRRDLYELFGDKRFVKSAGAIEIKRDGGTLRTDLDAVIFDRKTGTLGIFELKSQDPFARSAGEHRRQRDYFSGANKQVAACLHWLQRNDPNILLARCDARAAKTFRVQKVHLFVLGRYLAHFADGPERDRRAAWGTWPQVLRLAGERPFGPSDANPLGSLFNKLVKDMPLSNPGVDPGVREIAIGEGWGRVRIYPSFAAYKGAVG